MQPFEQLDDYDFMMPIIESWECDQATALGALLIRYLKPTSVIDVGCGPGIYLLPFLEHGCDILGIDACATGGAQIEGYFVRVDLRFPWKPQRRYDLALCIEVAEHLKEKYADTLVNTLAACSDIILLSAAGPNQGGDFHYNLKPKEWWIAKFDAVGYDIHPMNQTICDALRMGQAYAKVVWLPNNAVLFRRR